MVTKDQILSGLHHVGDSPTDGGRLEFIVVRPVAGGRELRERAYLSAESGVDGDRWTTSRWLTLPDGSPDPRVQVSLMNARILRLISDGAERISLAGDNLIMDLDLSEHNLAPGQRLVVGEVVVEVSDVAHTGCRKFMARYGRDAVKFVNSVEGRRLNLRGLYAKVIEPGVVCVGDAVWKVRA